MTNTSATEGFLPLSPVPGQTAIEDVFHDLIAGVTGLHSDMVRPRWQPEPPREPKPTEDWCAFGIIGYEPQNFPEIRHHGEGEGKDAQGLCPARTQGASGGAAPRDGYDEMVDHETLTVLASFYGPRHLDLARLMRRGVHVPQNRKLLRPAGLVFVKAGSIVPVPALVAMQWRARADLPLIFRLETRSAFSSLNLLQTGGSVRSDSSGATSNNDAGGLETPVGCQACSRACWRK